MFFTLSSINSSSVSDLHLNPANREAIVEFKNGSHYSYTNVDTVAMDDLLYNRKDDISVGKWVNTNLVKDSQVVCDNLDAVVRNIQREPIAA